MRVRVCVCLRTWCFQKVAAVDAAEEQPDEHRQLLEQQRWWRPADSRGSQIDRCHCPGGRMLRVDLSFSRRQLDGKGLDLRERLIEVFCYQSQDGRKKRV